MKLTLLHRQVIVVSILLLFFITGLLLTLGEQTVFNIVLFAVTKCIGMTFIVIPCYIATSIFNVKGLKKL
jgi:hypothetical protein